MKAFSKKALALAVLGLVAFGMADAAFAQTCPTVSSHTANSTPGGGGAWTNQTVGGGGFLDVTTPGLHSTNCALYVNVGTTPLANVRAFVSDISPVNEGRYRGRFYLNKTALTLTLANYQTELLNSFADTAPGSFNTDELQVYLIGGATPAIRFLVADAGKVSGFNTITQQLPASASGSYYIEFDLQKGAGSSTAVACNGGDAGCFRYWIKAVSDAAPVDGSPTGTYSASNAGWSGITQTNLGLFSTSKNFRDNNHSANVVIDEFDSRRQTFIGF